MARQIGRLPADARPALAHLVSCRVFRETAAGSDRSLFDPPPGVDGDVSVLVDSLADSSGRLQAITAVLQMRTRPPLPSDEPKIPAENTAV
jgi:hypothetical protein